MVMVAIMLGEVEQGIADCEQALAEAREAGSDGIRILILIYLGGQLLALGETARARDLFDRRRHRRREEQRLPL